MFIHIVAFTALLLFWYKYSVHISQLLWLKPNKLHSPIHTRYQKWSDNRHLWKIFSNLHSTHSAGHYLLLAEYNLRLTLKSKRTAVWSSRFEPGSSRDAFRRWDISSTSVPPSVRTRPCPASSSQPWKGAWQIRRQRRITPPRNRRRWKTDFRADAEKIVSHKPSTATDGMDWMEIKFHLCFVQRGQVVRFVTPKLRFVHVQTTSSVRGPGDCTDS